MFDEIAQTHPEWTHLPAIYTAADSITAVHKTAISSVVDVISAVSHVCSGAVADAVEALARKTTTPTNFVAATSPAALDQRVNDAWSSVITTFYSTCTAPNNPCSQHVTDCCGDGGAVCTHVNPFDPSSPSWCSGGVA